MASYNHVCFEHGELCIIVLIKEQKRDPCKHIPHTGCQFIFMPLRDIRTRPQPKSPKYPGKRHSS